MHPKRIYVELRVSFSQEGEMEPVQIKWKDGRIFEIDKILEVDRAASDAGSGGIRYTVKIMGHVRYLFFEDIYSSYGRPCWFVESMKQAEVGA